MGDMPVRVSRLYLITAVVGLISGVGGALVAQPAGRLIHPTAVRIGNTAADALDVSGGAQFGSGDVALIGTDGKINGPLSSTILDDLSGANLTSLNATNISTGTLASARGGVPANAVIFIPATTCPTGYTEYTTLRGRYAVGLVANGTSAATVGTALTNTENRAVGQHTHTQNAHNHGITDAGHTHTYNEHGGSTSPFTETGTVWGNGSQNTGNSTTGITINNQTATNQNTGSVSGTNAPYVQLLACQKQ